MIHSKSIRAALIVVIVVINIFVAAADETTTTPTCNACKFDGTDLESCIVWGKLDGEPFPWNLGTDNCKDNYGIVIKSIDPSSSCESANAFVNSLRFGDLSASASRLGLGVASEGGPFFVETFGTNDLAIELSDSVTIDGVTTSCETESDCYNAMKAYFDQGGAGFLEKDQVCEKLTNQARVDQNLEQSTLRIRLCQENVEENAIPVSCTPLGFDIGSRVRAAEDPDTISCSQFGLEMPLSQIEGCENHLSGSTEDGSGGGDEDDDDSNMLEDLLDKVGGLFGSSAPSAFVTTLSWTLMVLTGSLFA